MVYFSLPESLSVRVKVNVAVSLRPFFLGPTERHPSGWQKLTMFSGSGKSCNQETRLLCYDCYPPLWNILYEEVAVDGILG